MLLCPARSESGDKVRGPGAPVQRGVGCAAGLVAQLDAAGRGTSPSHPINGERGGWGHVDATGALG